MTTPGQEGFVKLPHEQILHTSPPRTSIEITSPKSSSSDPFSARCDSGKVYVTNQRIVYLPAAPTPNMQSFSSPILRLQDTFVRAPFFGANYWTASCLTVANGGIPADHALVELRLTFRDGGAFEFHTIFEQVKERLYQVHSVARSTGQAQSNVGNIHLEQLPAYEPSTVAEPVVQEPTILSPRPVRPAEARHTGNSVPAREPFGNDEVSQARSNANPAEPPPGYEESQT